MAYSGYLLSDSSASFHSSYHRRYSRFSEENKVWDIFLLSDLSRSASGFGFSFSKRLWCPESNIRALRRWRFRLCIESNISIAMKLKSALEQETLNLRRKS